MESKPLSIGDMIEVQFPPDREVWRPATIIGVDGLNIDVAFANTARLVLKVGGSIKFRLHQATPTGGTGTNW